MKIGNPVEVWCDACQGNQSECVDAESKFKEVNGRKGIKHIVSKKKSLEQVNSHNNAVVCIVKKLQDNESKQSTANKIQ